MLLTFPSPSSPELLLFVETTMAPPGTERHKDFRGMCQICCCNRESTDSNSSFRMGGNQGHRPNTETHLSSLLEHQ